MPKRDALLRIDERPASTRLILAGGTGGAGGGGGSAATSFADLTGTATVAQVPWAVQAVRLLTAGAGLTGGGDLSADRAFAVGAGDGISVAADSVAVDATVVRTSRTVSAGAGLTGGGDLGANRTLALATPGTLTAATANDATAHTHAITASADVGTTPAASLLKSTGGGGLTLGTLDVKGSATVTNGGDFSVGNVLMVNTAGTRVGINMAADPQFSLDVAGALRASYLVGPHAIQLDGATFIAHYDGMAPFETNPYGEPNGHKGQIGTPSGDVFYLRGKFGKAVCIGGGNINEIVNPSFEVNVTDGWSLGGTGSRARSGDRSYVGWYSCALTSGSGGDTSLYTTAGLAVTNGTSITLQARVYRTASHGAKIRIYDYSGSPIYAESSATLTGEWELVTCTYTNTSGSTKTVRAQLLNAETTAGRTVYFDAVQWEWTAYPTAYFDGTLTNQPVGGWGGTAHNSYSVRSPGLLTYPTAGNLSETAYTVMAWVNLSALSGAQTIFRASGTSAGHIILRANGNALQCFHGLNNFTSAGVLSRGRWHHVAMTYNGATLRMYVDGADVGGGSASGFSGMPASFYVGRSTGVAEWLDGLLDELVIAERALSAVEVRAIYESNAPVFAESSVFHFRASPAGLVYADEQGLWVKAGDGSAVLGVYAASGTKSWGGQTLAQGDILIGRGSNYMLWDDSAGTLQFAGNGAGLTSINGGNIQTGTVTATQINVATLSAVAVNTGSLSATGAISIVSGGRIVAKNTTDNTEIAGLTVESGFTATYFWAGASYANRGTAPFRVDGYGNVVTPVLATDTIGPKTGGDPVKINLLKVANNEYGSASVPKLAADGRASTGMFFTQGASSAESQVNFTVDSAAQMAIRKGSTVIQGTLLGVPSGGTGSSAYVWASGMDATPALMQNSSGMTRLDAASGQSSGLNVNGTTRFYATDGYAIAPATAPLLLVEGTVTIGSGNYTMASATDRVAIFMKGDKLWFVVSAGGGTYRCYSINLTATAAQSIAYQATVP